MAPDYKWWSGETTASLPLPVGRYTALPECRWTPDEDSDGMVDGYVHLTYTLRPDAPYGVIRRRLLREPFGGKKADETWLKDELLPAGLSTFCWWLPPWTGAIEAGRAYQLELWPRDGIESISVQARYMKAYDLKGLAT